MPDENDRVVDATKINDIGEWIAQAHVSERVPMCLHMRALHHMFLTSWRERAANLPDDPTVKAAAPMLEEFMGALMTMIEGLEDGAHVSAKSQPQFYRFSVPIGGKPRVFGLPPNEYEMATDPTGTPRPWSAPAAA